MSRQASRDDKLITARDVPYKKCLGVGFSLISQNNLANKISPTRKWLVSNMRNPKFPISFFCLRFTLVFNNFFKNLISQ